MKSDKAATLTWILKYNRTPYPYSPQNAALKGMEPKQPGYFDGNYFKQLKWKDYQDWGSLDENFKSKLIKTWHDDERIEGIGCNAGFNGEFYFSMIDFDLKNFESLEALEQAVTGWENRNPGISLCPRVRTQSGGYRYFIGFESIPKNWGNTIQFTLTQGGEKSLGELMVGSGGLGIILGKGLKGNYSWDRNACGDVPVFQSPESVGLFEIEKVQIINSIYDNKSISEEAREALSFIPVSQFDEDYQGWINLGMACRAAELDFEDWDNWSQGSSKYTNSKETFNHWKTFKGGGGITPGTLFKFAKDNGWNPPKRNSSYQKPLINTSNSQGNVSGNNALKPDNQSNVVPFQRQQPQFNIEDIEEELRQLAEQNLSKSKQQLKLNELARKFNLNSNKASEIFKSIKDEAEEETNLESLKVELEELLKNRNQSLDLTQYLPGNLAKIGEFANRLCLRPEVGLSAFLTVASSLLAVGSKIDLLDYTDFDQPMGMYTAICAEPSQKKSPLINKIALEPLLELQEKARKQYEQEMINYQIDYADWASDKNNPDPEPEKPILRRYFINGGSQAGIRNVLNTHSMKGWGVLVLTDELAASYKNNSKTYNAGLLEDFLTYYDGVGKIEALKDGFLGDFSQCLVSMLGGIQPGVISNYMNGSDGNGHWSRVNIVNQPVSPFLIPDNPPPSLDIKVMLVDFYRKLSQLPRLNLTLDAKAKAGFTRINNKCELYRVGAKTQALASLWGKMPGKIGRFAAMIHIIEQVWQYGTVQSLVVGKATLDRAVKLAKFYYQESYSLYADCSPVKEELAPQLMKIISIAEKRQTAIGASDVKRFDRELSKLAPDDIRAYFIQLVELGYGELVGKGCSLKFQIIDKNRQIIDKKIDAETPVDNGLQPIIDKIDKKIDKISNEPQPNPLDDITHIDDVAENAEQGEKLSILSTNPTNAYTEPSTASTDLSINCLFLSIIPSDSDERPPEPTPTPDPEPLNFDDLKEGDILFDGEGNLHQITKFDTRNNMWQSHRQDRYISRNDISTGQFHRATVEDITKLIKLVIKGRNKIQAQWLCGVYGGDANSLMALAIDSNDSLIEIYDFDYWE
ncbi:hypothetical protein PL9214100012 [Planktothrix tepida PCC 9214]|uniref:Primase C-terminal 2 domain-containing protein n=2 Tax=Planktothrix TaxID=54304 RepID=A0A1J1LEE2_9CYAN|nr:DUF3987 domain-containing protein [Planktothrix tepida]CUR30268.1 hypothetical protein PL9214100012 [Planktothrix tepida PCC 9214]